MLPANQSATTNPCNSAFSRAQPDLDGLPASRLLTPEEASAALGVTPQTLSAWRCLGRYALPFVKSGRKVYYRVSDLKAFIERRTYTQNPPKL